MGSWSCKLYFFSTSQNLLCRFMLFVRSSIDRLTYEERTRRCAVRWPLPPLVPQIVSWPLTAQVIFYRSVRDDAGLIYYNHKGTRIILAQLAELIVSKLSVCVCACARVCVYMCVNLDDPPHVDTCSPARGGHPLRKIPSGTFRRKIPPEKFPPNKSFPSGHFLRRIPPDISLPPGTIPPGNSTPNASWASPPP